MPYLDVIDPASLDKKPRVLFRYDPQRNLVQMKRGDTIITIDLDEYKHQANPTYPMDGVERTVDSKHSAELLG